MAKKKITQPQQVSYTTPEAIERLKGIDFLPQQMILQTAELFELIKIIRDLATEVDSLRKAMKSVVPQEPQPLRPVPLPPKPARAPRK